MYADINYSIQNPTFIAAHLRNLMTANNTSPPLLLHIIFPQFSRNIAQGDRQMTGMNSENYSWTASS